MALLKDLDDFDTNAHKGDWAFVSGDEYIAIQLGDDKFTDVAILPIKAGLPNAWTWDGNREAPTLSPSILHWGHGKSNPATWHGYLRDGKLEIA